MKITKRKTAFVLVMGILFSTFNLTGCSENTKMDPDQPLSVYYQSSANPNLEKKIFDQYNRAIGEKDREIEVREFEDTEQANQTIATEILAGKGPDVFVFDETGLEKYLSYAKEGAFEDLNPYFEKDSTISLDDYNQKILDYGVFDEKRRFIPLSYRVNAVFTTQQAMELYGLDPSVELSLDNLADYLNNIPSTQNGENVYLFDNNEFLRYMLLNGKIDIFTGSSSFQKQEFLTQAEGFYRLFQKFNQEIIWGSSMNLFKNKSLIFMSGSNPIIQGFSANGVVIAYRAWQDKTDNILIPKGIKSNQLDDGYYSAPQLIVAVNTNCKDKEQAFRFVKYLLSDSVQNWDSTAEYCTIGWPVKTSALEQVKQVMLEDEQKTYGTNSGYREYLDACFKIVDQVIGCRSAYFDVKYAKEIFDPLFDDYLNNKISVEELAKQLDSKTELYMKEN